MLFFKENSEIRKLLVGGYRVIVNDDHSMTKGFLRVSGPIWGILYVVFYAFLKFEIGYEESAFLRFASAFLLASFFFLIPKGKTLSSWQQLYIDSVLTFALPLLFAAHMALNHNNGYWQSSMVFAAFCFALFARAPAAIIGFPLVSGLVVYATTSGNEMKECLLTVIIASTLNLVMSSGRAFIKHYWHELAVLRVNKKQQDTIKTYVRPSILEEISRDSNPLEFKERMVKKAVLMVDIVGYTFLSEKISSHELYVLLNEYFSIVNKAVFSHGGEVDKFIGDAGMALFDEPRDCLMACEMLFKEHKELQEQRRARGEVEFKIGVGVSYGEMLLANFGSHLKMDRTVVGDSVNVCSRIEALTREFQVDLIASGDFVEALGIEHPGIRALAWTFVKGKTQPIKIFEVFSHKPLRDQKRKRASKSLLEALLERKKSSQEEWDEDFNEAVSIVNSENDNPDALNDEGEGVA